MTATRFLSLETIRSHKPEFRQAVRVMAATAVSFAAYQIFDLAQGYWAVLSVMIVMQGSIGNTLGLAIDRMIGTIAGALAGAIALALHTPTPTGLGVALVLVTGATVLMAAIRPQLRVAPVTAAIMLLTNPVGASAGTFVVDRVVEITLGSVIGVLAMVLIFPARSQTVIVERAIEALGIMQDLLLGEAEAVERQEPLPLPPAHAALRQALTAAEQAMKEADRERSTHLAEHNVPPAVPRTLWRVRNDIVLVGRGLDTALPGDVAEALAPAIARLLRAEAALVERCIAALTAHAVVAREDIAASHDEFAHAFDTLRQTDMVHALDFDSAGRVFGLAFTLERLHRDMADLVDRIDEVATGQPKMHRAPLAAA